ncbi:hypothetical protein C8J55DRAFT_528118 [Lentinula edodes]|uniref:Uncharacterized protein n=1 Tax=Lentinula lateritia TaxID=40482 RepID=A0A9W8ZSB0_9AGAR|nr:hypothetical protein C8J55DRAFT_528118 [Lentinula edodes]
MVSSGMRCLAPIFASSISSFFLETRLVRGSCHVGNHVSQNSLVVEVTEDVEITLTTELQDYN